jgi:CO/xanthine dehydrogenase Mo-binding subunit
MKYVNKPIRKRDAMQLVTGKAVYTNDIAPDNCLIVKLLRSPHANAIIESIDVSKALLIDGIEGVYTYNDVPKDAKRFTCAGQTYPEASPYDRLILDKHVRFVGDVVAIIAGKNEQVVERAKKLIKVKYNVLPALLDFHKAKDNEILVHPEDNWVSMCPVGADNKRNLCAHDESGKGDIDKVLAQSDIVIDRVYHTKACQQSMMEPFQTFCTIDTYGRLNVISSTQIVFHCRRIVANALGIPKTLVRVTKPRIGGGFGAKQTSVSEIYPAFVTWKTKKPSKIIFTREESQTASSPRHEMEMHVRLGATKDGIVRGIDLYTLSNTGAYGEHGPTTVGLSGHKSIPLYGKAEAFRFVSDVVYTNHMSAGAYRGYGATQGQFAVESAVNELAQILHMDPFDIRLKNMVKEGDVMPAYYNETLTSSALEGCLKKVRQMIGWDKKPRVYTADNGKVHALGMAMSMQGSGIGNLDVGGARIILGDEGIYNLSIAAADMGTGCDTTLAQIAAEVLECPTENIAVYGADTDTSPYDSGSYASSTTYVTGKATELCALALREKIIAQGAKMLNEKPENVTFDGEYVAANDNLKVSLKQIATTSQAGAGELEASYSHTSKNSPPPFMVGACELEIDPDTGKVDVVEFDAAVDCGTPINPNLARVQAEGGILQGIGMALMENIEYTNKGVDMHNSFMQYKIPTRMDVGRINVELVSSYENQGPFGAKSIGEVVINTPLASIADALSQAVGIRFTELPIMPEQIALKEEFFRKNNN